MELYLRQCLRLAPHTNVETNGEARKHCVRFLIKQNHKKKILTLEISHKTHQIFQ